MASQLATLKVLEKLPDTRCIFALRTGPVPDSWEELDRGEIIALSASDGPYLPMELKAGPRADGKPCHFRFYNDDLECIFQGMLITPYGGPIYLQPSDTVTFRLFAQLYGV